MNKRKKKKENNRVSFSTRHVERILLSIYIYITKKPTFVTISTDLDELDIIN